MYAIYIDEVSRAFIKRNLNITIITFINNKQNDFGDFRPLSIIELADPV